MHDKGVSASWNVPDLGRPIDNSCIANHISSLIYFAVCPMHHVLNQCHMNDFIANPAHLSEAGNTLSPGWHKHPKLFCMFRASKNTAALLDTLPLYIRGNLSWLMNMQMSDCRCSLLTSSK